MASARERRAERGDAPRGRARPVAGARGQLLLRGARRERQLPGRPAVPRPLPGQAAAAVHPGRGDLRRDCLGEDAGRRARASSPTPRCRTAASPSTWSPTPPPCCPRPTRWTTPRPPPCTSATRPAGSACTAGPRLRGRGDAARARRRRRRRQRRRPARQGGRGAGHRRRRRRGEGPGRPRAGLRRGDRPARRGRRRPPSRRPPAAGAPTSSTTRSAATPTPSPPKCVAFEGRIVVVGFASGVDPAARPQPRPGQELLDPRPALGPLQHQGPRRDPRLPRASSPSSPPRAPSSRWSASGCRSSGAADAVQRVADGVTTGRVVVVPGSPREATDEHPDRRTPRVDADDCAAAPASCSPPTRPATTDRLDFLRARFDAGLAWVHYPEGLGGLGAPRSLQAVVDAELEAAGAPDNDPRRIGIGLGMAAPTILALRHRGAEAAASCARCGPARRCGASCSASPAPAPTSPRSAPGRSATATTGWSTARRCGPPAPTSPAGPSSSPAPTRTCPSTAASPTSSAT